MDAAALRSLQAPIKNRYREEPEGARVVLRAEGRFEGNDITCTVDGWAGPAVAGLHPSTGGTGEDACSGDMLLQALVACAGVTLRSVATAMGIEIRDARIRAEGVFDARGTLGVSKEVPVGLTDISLAFELDTDADAATIGKLIQLTERYCVIYQTLSNPPRMSAKVKVAGAA
ncbi:MAG TPA: OsmC family protein [Alphaproteobacteria bacterium]|nr:OsmC family protein [Alphaproteobacteria bacterium]